jgi:pyrimidine operon attenuation protein/uracil phosphoribosyltransferase
MNSGERILCDGKDVDGLITAIAASLHSASPHPGAPVYLIGIRTRGVPLAQRLAAKLEALSGVPVRAGAVDITLYRDDLDKTERWPVLRGTEIPFNLDGAEVVLVDDVLFTGRTVRAALNTICDLGRPARVRLAVLVDRGHRELPIQADAAGLVVATERSDHISVRLRPLDAADQIVHSVHIPGRSSQSRSQTP